MPFSLRIRHVCVLATLSSLVGCNSVAQPGLDKRLPYTVALQTVRIKPFTGKALAADDAAFTTKFEPDQLTAQIRESLLGVFEEVTVFPPSGEPPTSTDLILRSEFEYDSRVKATSDGWLSSCFWFAMGTPIGWFIDDREYEVATKSAFMLSLPPELAARGRSELVTLTPVGQPAATAFLDRADTVPHYLGALVMPTVLLASESDTVKRALPGVLGKNLADSVARAVINNKEKLEDDKSAEFRLSRFETGGAAGSFVFSADVIYAERAAKGLIAKWRRANGEWASCEWKAKGAPPTPYRLDIKLEGVGPGELFHLKITQDGGSGAVRTYTFRAPRT